MKYKLIFFSILLFSSGFTYAQRKTKLNTNNKGTLFGYAGYNRSAYSASDVQLSSTNYDFKVGGMMFSDNEEQVGMGNYFKSSSPQFNVHLGFFVANKWAVTLGMDRLNYFSKANQNVTFDGAFSPDAHSDFNGSYQNEDVLLNRNQLYIQQNGGINYVRVGLMRVDQFYKSRKAEFAFNTIVGVGIGALFSGLDYTFDSQTVQNVSSLSGFGVSGHLGLRFDFFQHVFLQASLSGGLFNQGNIQLTTNSTTTASHKMGYLSPEISIGFNIFANTSNGCGTCPQW
ncbi:MAG: hypothetical protein COA32_01695 [Fluviicola sp.]|nr:MAG: hypothetical protein COA32_01695 [Fluviicola sp.]